MELWRLTKLKKQVTKTVTVAKKAETNAKKQDSNKVATSSHGKDWLLGLSSSSYTLQVVATREPSQLEKLIQKEHISHDYAYFSKPVKDSIYYVLVVGNFQTRQEAIDSVSKLPENLRKNNPWPIKLDSVQQHLK